MIKDKADLTDQRMEVSLALLVTASQACGFILLGISRRFKDDEALDDASGVYVPGRHCGWVGDLRVNTCLSLRVCHRAARRAQHAARVMRAASRGAQRAALVTVRRPTRRTHYCALLAVLFCVCCICCST